MTKIYIIETPQQAYDAYTHGYISLEEYCKLLHELDDEKGK